MIRPRIRVKYVSWHGYRWFKQDYYDINKMLGYVQMEDGSGMGYTYDQDDENEEVKVIMGNKVVVAEGLADVAPKVGDEDGFVA